MLHCDNDVTIQLLLAILYTVMIEFLIMSAVPGCEGSNSSSASGANASAAGGGGKKRSNARMGGDGKTWVDKSLDEWPENDWRLFAGDLGNEVTDDLLSRAFGKYPSFAKAKVVREAVEEPQRLPKEEGRRRGGDDDDDDDDDGAFFLRLCRRSPPSPTRRTPPRWHFFARTPPTMPGAPPSARCLTRRRAASSSPTWATRAASWCAR